jgi:DNA polymerase III subunit beta
MKFKVSQEPFLQGISRVAGVIPTRTPLTFLYNVHATLSENNLTLTASDGDVFLITTVQVEGSENGSILVPARPLLDLLREMPGTEIEFNTSAEQHLLVNTSKGKFTIPGEDPSRFPAAPSDRPPHKLSFGSEELKNILEQTTFAVSHDELRPALTGLLLQFMEKEMRAVSTDGHRMVKLVKSGLEGTGAAEDVEVIVPLRTLNLLQKSLDGIEKVDIFLASNRVVFDTGELVITSKVVEGKFPAYDAVIPKDNPQHLQLDLEPFTAAVRRVSIFANPINRLVVLTLDSTSVKIFAEDPDSGRQGEEDVEALYTGPGFQIGYNANYLLEALRHMPGNAVDLFLGSPTSAGILKPRESAVGQDLMMLLMPIRLQ